MRTAFLMAVTSARRASELQAICCDTMVWRAHEVIAYTDPEFSAQSSLRMAWHCNQPMSFPAMRGEEDGELTKLCLRDTMHAYYLRTKVARRRPGANQFLLCYGSKFLGQPVSKQRISKWLQELVRDCYKREGLEPPGGVKGHQVSKQATSWADLAGVDPATICQAATWRTSKGI